MFELKTVVVVTLLFISVVLLGIGLLTRATGGLFWSRSPQNFAQDKNDPRFEKERQVGNRVSTVLLKFVPPITIGLVVILFLILLNII